jgi:Flp pilus assembly protein TadB
VTVSRQRAQRRTQRQQQQRSVAEARAAREQQRRQARRQARPAAARRRTGWAGLRRSRGQRLAIAAVAVLGTALIWLLVDWPLAIGLTALLLLALPAFVVLTMGRRY